jgi:hypothetical protein
MRALAGSLIELAIAPRSAVNITMNQPPNTAAGIQNGKIPFQANGPRCAKNTIPPGMNKSAAQKLK